MFFFTSWTLEFRVSCDNLKVTLSLFHRVQPFGGFRLSMLTSYRFHTWTSISPFQICIKYVYLEPNRPLFLKVNQNKAFSNQNNGHLSSRYRFLILKKVLLGSMHPNWQYAYHPLSSWVFSVKGLFFPSHFIQMVFFLFSLPTLSKSEFIEPTGSTYGIYTYIYHYLPQTSTLHR